MFKDEYQETGLEIGLGCWSWLGCCLDLLTAYILSESDYTHVQVGSLLQRPAQE